MKRSLKSLAGPVAFALVVLVFGTPSAPGAALVPDVGGAAHAYYGWSPFGCSTGYVGNFGMFDPSVESTWGFGSTSSTGTFVPCRAPAGPPWF